MLVLGQDTWQMGNDKMIDFVHHFTLILKFMAQIASAAHVKNYYMPTLQTLLLFVRGSVCLVFPKVLYSSIHENMVKISGGNVNFT